MAPKRLDNSPAGKAKRLVERFEKHEPAFRPHWARMTEARDFLFKAQQYSVRARAELQRKNRIAPITNDTWDLVRFKADQIANSELYVDVQPEAPDDLVAPMPEYDPSLKDFRAPTLKPRTDIKLAKWALERDLFDPAVGYDRVRERVALEGVGARAGAYVLDWDPSQGVQGRIFARRKRPQDILWHSAYLHPQEPGNPFVYVREQIEVEDARLLYPRFAEQLKGDHVKSDYDTASEPVPGQPTGEGKITLLRCYELYDSSVKRKLEPSHKPEPLPEPERYLACADCGWESGQAGSMRLPAKAPCPECGAMALRIDTTGRMVPTAAFTKGKRYTVVAQFQTTLGPLEERGWPGDPPSFPVFYFVPGVNPDEITGLSDTEWHSDIQCAINAAFRQGVEQMQRNRDYLFVLLNAFTDAQGEPYQFDGSGEYVAYTEQAEALNAINHFQGSGLPQALPTWVNMLREVLRSNRGIGQLGGAPENLKGVQVGVAQRYLDSGDVPVDRAVDTFRREESIQLQNWHVMQRNLYTKADWIAALGPGGERAFIAMRGEDLPAAKVRVTAKPMIRAADLQHAKDLRELLASQPPLSEAEFDIMAQAANIPQEWVTAIKREKAEQQQAAEAAAGQPTGTAAGGQAGPGMAPQPPNGQPEAAGATV